MAAASVLLLFLSPIGLGSPHSFTPHLFWIAHLFFPLILGFWLWKTPGEAIGVLAWSCALMTLVGLACNSLLLLSLPLEFAALGGICRWGRDRWKERVRESLVFAERMESEMNTLQGDLASLSLLEQGAKERLTRYQKLAEVVSAFEATLSLDSLVEEILKQVGKMIGPKADRALLYLADPQSLRLQLKSVWRREPSGTVKAKTGDPFDLWVMRQAQPLLVEDLSKEFRFPKASFKELGRHVGSLLVVPLMSERRFAGVLRVESSQPNALGVEDLRLVRIMGDLASLGIENSLLYQETAQLAITDDLTALSVRTYFEMRLEEETARSRINKKPFSILLIDIDLFKGYNDTFGHSAGDKLLKELARLIQGSLRPGELAARFGGEELVLLLPEVGLEEAVSRAEELRHRVEVTSVELRREKTRTTVSIGVTSFPRDAHEAQDLLRVADERLYRAKAQGRNQVC